ncbi:MAG TPA: MBL fold metallo-hydrolase [Vicinamibacterales bacterium]|nr:MBL fold metallo-hydrolase [Vicinamibacterales bacterium]
MRARILAAAAALVLSASGAHAQQDFSKVEIKVEKVADGLFMLIGAGGNIALSVGDDATFIVDDQYAPLTDKIVAAIRTVTEQPVKFVVNTHWHGDHTGGNENFGKAGAVIIAHDNVRQRMSVETFNERFKQKIPAAPHAALPVVTFAEAVTLHLNGDTIRVTHVPPAHTDGDAIVHFTKANVLHMGDLFFNGGYPFVDVWSGGNVDGILGAVDKALAMGDDKTRIIPGHGPLADKAALERYREVVSTVRDRVKALVDQGKSLEDVKAAQPSKEFDAQWGQGFMKGETFVELVYMSLTGKK